MRVLVTGMTPQQCGGGTKLGYEPVADLFVKGLRHAGAEVQHSTITVDEDVTRFDAVVIGIVPPLSLAGKHVNPSLMAIAACEREGVPLTMFVDDWRFPRFVTNLGTCVRLPHHLTKEFFSHRNGWAWSQDHQADLVAVIERLRDEEWPPLIIPAFSWGDHAKLVSRLPRANPAATVCIDPTAFCRPYSITVAPWEDRPKRWVLGTVTDQKGWLTRVDPTWEVEYVGSRASKADIAVPEADLVARYGQSWGVLSPVYTQITGTGWWRNRFVYAAHASAVLYCDSREAPRLGDAYGTHIHEIEKRSARDLANLADEQAEVLGSWTQAADDVAAQLLATVVR